MNLLHLYLPLAVVLASVTAESTYSDVKNCLCTGGSDAFTVDVAMDVSLLEEECLEAEFAGEEDYYDELVREVIDENPPEEQGIRPEWKEKVGWYRKEDIYTQSNNEGPSDETGENDGELKKQVTKLFLNEVHTELAEFQDKTEDRLRQRLTIEMKEKEALKARHEKAERKVKVDVILAHVFLFCYFLLIFLGLLLIFRLPNTRKNGQRMGLIEVLVTAALKAALKIDD